MLIKTNRPKANGAGDVFVRKQSYNGKNGADPPNGKAPCYGRSSQVTSAETAYSAGDQAQAQSRNGSNGQLQSGWNERQGPITKIVRYGKHSFVQILRATVRDKRLSDAALGLLVRLLSLPAGWQPHPKHLKAEYGLKPHTWKKLMRELRVLGYGRLCNTRSGRHLEFCEWPKWAEQGEISKVRNSHHAKNAPYKNEPLNKNERKAPESKRKQVAQASAGADSCFDLASPEEQKLILIYTELLSDRFWRWMPVTQYTDALQDALAAWVDTPEDFEQLCRLAAMVCDKEPSAVGEWSSKDGAEKSVMWLPKPQGKHRGRNSVIDLIWKNY